MSFALARTFIKEKKNKKKNYFSTVPYSLILLTAVELHLCKTILYSPYLYARSFARAYSDICNNPRTMLNQDAFLFFM